MGGIGLERRCWRSVGMGGRVRGLLARLRCKREDDVEAIDFREVYLAPGCMLGSQTSEGRLFLSCGLLLT